MSVCSENLPTLHRFFFFFFQLGGKMVKMRIGRGRDRDIDMCPMACAFILLCH